MKKDCNSCGHNYLPNSYYPCNQCNFFDKYQDKSTVAKLFEHSTLNISVQIMGIKDIMDHIEGNSGVVERIDLQRLTNIIGNLKSLERL